MTRQEAIAYGKRVIDLGLNDETQAFCELAIKALEQEPKFIAKPDGTIEQIKNCDDCLYKREWEKIGKLISVVLEKQTEQEPCGDWYDVSSNEMTLEQARQAVKDLRKKLAECLEQEPCEMTAEEYRQRMIQAFHNADTDGLIAICVLPTEKEFEHLEWLLKNHYKKEPCEDAISRQAAIDMIERWLECSDYNEAERHIMRATESILYDLPSVNPQTRWIPVSERLPEDRDWYLGIFKEPDTGWINPIPFICDHVGSKTKATTKEHWILRGFTDRDERIDYYFNLECVAWQPLPEPYKAESEGEV